MPNSSDNSAADLDTLVPCKPFLKWVGGKSQLIPELTRRLPKNFNRYFEPFLGGAALFFNLQPAQAFLSDINPDLINAYQVVCADVEKLISDLKTHRYEEQYFYQIRNLDRSDEFAGITAVQKASRLIYLNKTGFNGLYRVNSKGQYNVPFGRYTNPNFCDQDNLRACSLALQASDIRVASFIDILQIAQVGDFAYFDPPYVPLNATANFTGYDKAGFDIQMQTDLRDICLELDKRGVKFMLSNSSASVVTELYSAFKIESVSASRMVNSKASKRGPVEELIIRNYSK